MLAASPVRTAASHSKHTVRDAQVQKRRVDSGDAPGECTTLGDLMLLCMLVRDARMPPL